MKIPFVISLIVLLIVAAGGFYLVYEEITKIEKTYTTAFASLSFNQQHISEHISQYTHRENNQTTNSILFVGDIMLDRGVESKIENNGNGNYLYPFFHVRSLLTKADLVFGNLEGSLSNVGSDQGHKYAFHFPKKAASALQRAGFDVLSLANNHMTDWGMESLCKTPQNLKQFEINSVGAGCDKKEAEAPYITELPNEISVGIVGYSQFFQHAEAGENIPGFSKWDEKHIQTKIQDLRQQDVDVIVVSLHWGTEYEDRYAPWQQDIAHNLIESGADIIVGHHPHVPQEIERYREGWIIYSLGNFVFDQDWSDETMRGLMAKAKIANGEVVDVQPIPVQLNENFQPTILNN